MKTTLCLIIQFLVITLFCGCTDPNFTKVTSPDQAIELSFSCQNGTPNYCVVFHGDTIIKPSVLGFELKEANALKSHFKIDQVKVDCLDTIWQQPWGENKKIRNNYNELKIRLKEKTYT